MSFAIEFIEAPREIEGEQACYAQIVIEDFKESFVASLHTWTLADYQKQWKNAVRRVLEEKKDAILLTYYRPRGFIQWWSLYLEDEKIFVHNQFFDLKSGRKDFDPHNPHEHLYKRETIDEDGDPISEWETSLESLKEFYQKICSTN